MLFKLRSIARRAQAVMRRVRYGYVRPFTDRQALWGGLHYWFPRRGFSFNEGAGPINFTVSWDDKFFWYVYAFGYRAYSSRPWPSQRMPG